MAALDEADRLQDVVPAVGELHRIKREYDWAHPSGSLLGLISRADRRLFELRHPNARTFRLRGPWVGGIQLAGVLSLFPLLVAAAIAVIAVTLRLADGGLAFGSAFAGLYSASLVHEWSHALAMAGSCRPCAAYGVAPFAGVRLEMRFRKECLSAADIVLLYAGGSLGNLALAGLAAGVGAVLGDGIGPVLSLPLSAVVWANLALGVANLVPAGFGSTDGAKLALWLRARRSKGVKGLDQGHGAG
ncbi:MAG: hypothetical protein K6T75_08060 [Acetobacteraceae bacterium]|nr:hypothetical protein [Acetobacteraceae bacterium]